MLKKKHKFRFGVNVSGKIASGNGIRTIARKMEDLGYSTFGTGDHLGTELAPLTMLMAAAEATTTLRVGSMVLGNDFRHPAFLAKETATIDVLSGGRLELGLGTGWQLSDYEQSGISFDSPGIRVSRLEEAITIIKGFFGEQPVTYEGNYYKITELNGLPKPTQSPHPPFVIGGGAKRMLTIAAREADIVGINFKTTADGQIDFKSATAEATLQKIEWVREAAAERFDSIELNAFLLVALISNDPEGALANWLGQYGVDLKDFAKLINIDEIMASPHFLIGTEDELVNKLRARREQFGISYYTVFGEENIEPFAPIVARLAST